MPVPKLQLINSTPSHEEVNTPPVSQESKEMPVDIDEKSLKKSSEEKKEIGSLQKEDTSINSIQTPTNQPLDTTPNRGGHMSNYIIALKTDYKSDHIKIGDRKQIYEIGTNRNAAFQERLRAFLEQSNLLSEVGYISSPTFLPNITVQCTEQVVKKIEYFFSEDVEFVTKDSSSIKIIQ